MSGFFRSALGSHCRSASSGVARPGDVRSRQRLRLLCMGKIAGARTEQEGSGGCRSPPEAPGGTACSPGYSPGRSIAFTGARESPWQKPLPPTCQTLKGSPESARPDQVSAAPFAVSQLQRSEVSLLRGALDSSPGLRSPALDHICSSHPTSCSSPPVLPRTSGRLQTVPKP